MIKETPISCAKCGKISTCLFKGNVTKRDDWRKVAKNCMGYKECEKRV